MKLRGREKEWRIKWRRSRKEIVKEGIK